IGWTPPSRSTMESRRWPSAAGPSVKKPSASGPRWAMAPAILATAAASGAPSSRISPAIPHIRRSVPRAPALLRAVGLLGDGVGALALRLEVGADEELGQEAHEQAEDAHQGEEHAEEGERRLHQVLGAEDLVADRGGEGGERGDEREEAEAAE